MIDYLTGDLYISFNRLWLVIPFCILFIWSIYETTKRRIKHMIWLDSKKERNSLKNCWQGVQDCYDKIEDLEEKTYETNRIIESINKELLMENDGIDFNEVAKALDVDYEEGCDEVERFVPLKDFLEIDDENYYKY